MDPFAHNKNLSWEPPAAAMARWEREVRAAKQDSDTSISIYDYIGADWNGEGVTTKRIAAALRNMDGKDVVVNINSPGGDMFEGMSIYNSLKEYNGKVTVKVLGLAASAASIIAMAGDEVQVAKSGFLMIHNSWALVMGNRHDLADAANLFAKFDGSMAKVYADITGIEVKKIHKMMDEETWLSGEEAVAAGFADGLLPTDAVEKTDNKPKSALNRIDTELAKSGLPRSERRKLLQELKENPATPSAGENITPSADDQERILREILACLKQPKGN